MAERVRRHTPSPEPSGARPHGAEQGTEDKVLHERFAGPASTELDRLPVVPPGTALERGGIYFDLDRPDRGPFTAAGGEIVGPHARLIARRSTDDEVWDRVVPKDRLVQTDAVRGRAARDGRGVTRPAILND